MAVAAAVDCLRGFDRAQRRRACSSPRPPTRSGEAGRGAHREGARPAPRRRAPPTSSGSLRAGTDALRAALDAVAAGSARRVLVIASDCRLGAPRLGARAQLRRRRGRVPGRRDGRDRDARGVARRRRRDHRRLAHRGRPLRAHLGGPLRRRRRATRRGSSRRCGPAREDRRRAPATSRRPRSTRPTSAATPAPRAALRLEPSRSSQDPLFGKLGNAGAARSRRCCSPPRSSSAKPGERILLASYGDGAARLRASRRPPQLEKLEPRRGVAWHLARRRAGRELRHAT